MALKGLSSLKKIGDAIVSLSRVPSQVAKASCEGIEDAIADQFARGVDPFGKSWAPLAASTRRRGRTPPPLTDEGVVSAASVVPSGGAGLSVAFGRDDIAEIHNKGNGRIPRRQIWPVNARELKKSSWGTAIAEAYADTINKNADLKAAGASISVSAPQMLAAAE